MQNQFQYSVGGVCRSPRLSTRGGEGVKIGSKLVHVVVEWSLTSINDSVIFTESYSEKAAYFLNMAMFKNRINKKILFKIAVMYKSLALNAKQN